MTPPTLENSLTLLRQNRLADTLTMIRQVMEKEGCMNYADRLQMLCEDYDRMLHYMLEGFVDDQRPLLYSRLQLKAWQLIQDVELAWRIKNKVLYIGADKQRRDHSSSRELIRSVLEGYVGDMAMVMLMPEDERKQRRLLLEERHQSFMSALFAQLWTSPQWSADDQLFYTQLVQLPTIEPRDALLIVSAVSIAVVNLFDFRKFSFLVDTYQQAADEHIRQRALIGWAFALPEQEEPFLPDLKRVVRCLLADDGVRRELLELQIQVYWCLSAEHDNAEIQRDIIPVIIKNNHYNITRFGITETEQDDLEDILNPDAEEQRMEEMEQSVNRMMNMQKAGSDIFFGGFSQMKRFAFFNDMANWLMPFYLGHPQIASALARVTQQQLPALLLQQGSFCDSDKYSLILAMTQIYNRLPTSYMQMLESQEIGEGMGPSEEERRSPAFIRRMYLQDLYRFYMLFTHRDDLVNCFVLRKNNMTPRKHPPAQFFYSDLLKEPSMDEEKLKLAKFLAKRGHWNNLSRALGSFYMERSLRPADYFMLEARLAMQRNQYSAANKSYQIALQLDNDHMEALNGWARTSMLSHYYSDALIAYQKLIELQPDNQNARLNECIALLKLQRADEAMEKLFKLSYENEADDNVKRVMAWGMMCQGRMEQAEVIYDQLLINARSLDASYGTEQQRKPAGMHEEDFLNAAYCQWLVGKVEQAVALFADYVRILNRHDDRSIALGMLEASFDDDREFILAHHVSETEMRLMIDLVKKSL